MLQADYPPKEVKKIVKDITARCLRRWDGFLAVRAGTDSLGRKKGVWKDKFESVRCAVMLLAFRSVNAELQRQVLRAVPGAPEPSGQLHVHNCYSLHSAMLCCVCAVLCCAVLCHAVLRCAVLCYAALRCTMQCCAVLSLSFAALCFADANRQLLCTALLAGSRAQNGLPQSLKLCCSPQLDTCCLCA